MAKLLINSSFFKHNLNLIASHIQDKSKLALVLKDNAYGHGIQEIATLAREYEIESVFVKNEFEALQISHYFPHITALYGEVSLSAPQNIYQSIHSLQSLHTINPQRKIELKINTGMNRNGIEPNELDEALQIILKRKLSLIGVFAHNGYSDMGGEKMLEAQEKFQEIKQYILHLSQTLGFPTPRFHSLNSSGALRSSEITDDLVRIGIAAYGYCYADTPLSSSLKPIASLWANQISSRQLSAGDCVGYDGAGILEDNAQVSTYDLGYGDGLFRLNQNHQGKLKCKDGEIILPKMSMDCFSAICNKQELCLFDDACNWAKFFDTIAYDVLVKLSPNIPKIIV